MNDIKPEWHNYMDAAFLEQTLNSITALTADKKALDEEIKEIYDMAKMHKLEPKMIREMLKLRKMEKADAFIQEKTRRVYVEAIGIVE
jgi:uncharacterized protein (UPF0335 family)